MFYALREVSISQLNSHGLMSAAHQPSQNTVASFAGANVRVGSKADMCSAARRLAEAGCTMHEIAAITGHASLNEVQRYTKAADQKRLALPAMEKAK
jgi:integrase